MGRPQKRTVRLEAGLDGREGPADGRTIAVGHDWAWVAVVDGELLQFDSDDDPAEAIKVLGRVKRRTDWAQYSQEDPGHLDVFNYVGNLQIYS